MMNQPVSEIPQWILQITQNACMCTFQLQNYVMWIMGLVYCGNCTRGLLNIYLVSVNCRHLNTANGIIRRKCPSIWMSWIQCCYFPFWGIIVQSWGGTLVSLCSLCPSVYVCIHPSVLLPCFVHSQILWDTFLLMSVMQALANSFMVSIAYLP